MLAEPALGAAGGAPVPVIMARAVPVDIAAQRVWGGGAESLPLVQGSVVAEVSQMSEEERRITINAKWPTPSESWGALGNRLRVFFQAWRPAYANRRYVVSLVVSHFGVNFASQHRPMLDAEESLKRALIDRYVETTPCRAYCFPPGAGGNYNRGSAGLLEWWCKAVAWCVVALAVSGGFMLSRSLRQSSQEEQIMQAIGLACVFAGLFSPALWCFVSRFSSFRCTSVATCAAALNWEESTG